ncbi:DUF883 family protein [Paracoccus homiensis]|uniref:DUF883 family protein n=1 Tax=Paracoccus homiensis TaxID=364199 RepID=UPI00398D014F
MSNPNEAAKSAKAEAESQFERVKERGAEMAGNVREAGREYAEKARQRGQDYADRARDQADHLYEAGSRRADEAAFYAELGYEEVSDIVRRNPVQSLGIAAGVGFLLGLIVARR